MAIISLIGSKGGVGTSLVATNLGCALASSGSTLLIDLHIGNGVDDLLLDSSSEKPWTDLVPVVAELKSKHIDLTTSPHPSGLKIMQSPEGWVTTVDDVDIQKLAVTLAASFKWCLLDLVTGMSPQNESLFSISDAILLVTSADPPALRSARRLIAATPQDSGDRVGLILNQINRQHPSTAGQIADSLSVPLLAALPPDPRSVGYQIHFGRPCASDSNSSFGRSIRGLASRLQKSVDAEAETEAAK